MKTRKKFLAITAAACLAISAFTLSACSILGSLGGSKRTFEKVGVMSEVVEGTFESAGYTKKAASSDSSAVAVQSVQGVLSARTLRSAVAAKSGVSVYSDHPASVTAPLFTALKLHLGEGLKDVELDARERYKATSSALYQGLNIAVLAKSVAEVMGDGSFGKTYSFIEGDSYMHVRVTEKDGGYEFLGSSCVDAVSYGEENESCVNMFFKEYENGKFDFTLAHYQRYGNEYQMRFVYYDSEKYIVDAKFEEKGGYDFSKLELSDFRLLLKEFSFATFDGHNYVVEEKDFGFAKACIIQFMTDTMGYTGDKYLTAKSLTKGETLVEKDAVAIVAKQRDNTFVNDYIGDMPSVSVRDSYTVPEGVTVLGKYSVPATKKLIIPKHVKKIGDLALCYPQYLEEIVFEDPDNGALTQIGEDDEYLAGKDHVYNKTRYFLTSFTKVKNFVLPKTVKKIAGRIIVTSAMETLDLTAYTRKSETGDISIIFGALPFYEDGIYKELGSIENLYVNDNCSVQVAVFGLDYTYECPDETYEPYNEYWAKVDERIPQEVPKKEAYFEYAKLRGYEKTEAFVTNFYAYNTENPGVYQRVSREWEEFRTILRLTENLYVESEFYENVVENLEREYEINAYENPTLKKVNVFVLGGEEGKK